MGRLGKLRDERGIPRWVRTGTGDNLIEIDLDNPVFVEAMLHKAKPATHMLLEDSRLLQTNVFKRVGESFCNQVVIGYSARSVDKSTLSPQDRPRLRASQARRAPSDAGRWLTIKFYDERVQLEALLTETLIPWIEGNIEIGLSDKWHFLRFADPQPHLRFRFRGSSFSVSHCLGELYRRLDGIKFSVDDYYPEVERYGGEIGMELCESVFMADSRLAAQVIRTLPKELAVRRWELSLAVIDSMLNAADLPVADRIKLLTNMRDSYADYGGVDVARALPLINSSFRKRRGRMEQAIGVARAQVASVGECYQDIRELAARRDELECPLVDVVSSLVHMHLNRVFGVRQVEQEVVTYDYLRKLYRAQAAKDASRVEGSGSRARKADP